jgi:hypothetical protein
MNPPSPLADVSVRRAAFDAIATTPSNRGSASVSGGRAGPRGGLAGGPMRGTWRTNIVARGRVAGSRSRPLFSSRDKQSRSTIHKSGVVKSQVVM